jgi:phosphate transport system protein
MSLEALSALDAEIGAEINIKDDAVDQDYTTLYNLLKAEPINAGATEQLMLMVLAIHHLERMADHAANIGQRVAFIVTGKRA